MRNMCWLVCSFFIHASCKTMSDDADTEIGGAKGGDIVFKVELSPKERTLNLAVLNSIVSINGRSHCTVTLVKDTNLGPAIKAHRVQTL